MGQFLAGEIGRLKDKLALAERDLAVSHELKVGSTATPQPPRAPPPTHNQALAGCPVGDGHTHGCRWHRAPSPSAVTLVVILLLLLLWLPSQEKYRVAAESAGAGGTSSPVAAAAAAAAARPRPSTGAAGHQGLGDGSPESAAAGESGMEAEVLPVVGGPVAAKKGRSKKKAAAPQATPVEEDTQQSQVS